MRTLKARFISAALVLSSTLSLSAATPHEFYAALLRRGIAAFDGGNYAEASRTLRLAAFGLVDALEPYETAHVYLGVSSERLGDTDRARDSVLRILAAERVERRYAALVLPPAVRVAFQSLASRVLTAEQLAALNAPASVPPAAAAGSVPASQPPRPVQVPSAIPAREPAAREPVRVEPAKPEPQRVEPAPAPVERPPATTTVEPPRVVPPAPSPAAPAIAQPQPAPDPVPSTAERVTPPVVTAPRPAPAPSTPAWSAAQVAAKLDGAERLLNASNLPAARAAYRELLEQRSIERPMLIRLAEGLYRSRDFRGARAAFERLGQLRAGEEPYRYYVAVALYETGEYANAARELAAALPFIEITPDVSRYRAKIEGAVR